MTSSTLSSGSRARLVPGSISTGTLRAQDLLPAFAQELGRLAPSENNKLRAQAVRITHQINSCRKQTSPGLLEEADDCIVELCSRLDALAHAHGLTFGAHPADGADFGFWPQGEDD